MSHHGNLPESELVGSRVSLTVEEGEYKGTVISFNARDGALTLSRVTFDCDGSTQQVLGAQKFLRSDVRKICVLEAGPDTPVPEAKVKPAAMPRNDKMVMARGSTRVRCGREHLYERELVDDSLLLSQVALGSDAEDEDSESGCQPRSAAGAESRTDKPKTPPPILPRPSGFTVIDSAQDVADAVDYLLRQEQVGISAEGVLLGRRGELSVVTIATAEFVFLFDMVTLSGAGVTGLKPLLESLSVLKVIHDCRQLADLLWHQCTVRLSNVFDTQVAEVSIYHQLYGRVPAYVTDVAHVLVRQLGLHPQQVFLPRYRLEKMAEDQRVWMRRPLSDRLLDGAVKNAVYLRELRHVQVERMFRSYTRCVDVHLASVRDGDDEDAANAPFESHRLPVKVQELLDAPRKPHAYAASDPDNPRLDSNVQGDAGAPVGFTRNVWRHSVVK